MVWRSSASLSLAQAYQQVQAVMGAFIDRFEGFFDLSLEDQQIHASLLSCAAIGAMIW